MFVHRLLLPDDDLDRFDCGVTALNDWLTSHAQRAHQQGVVRVYVWVDDAEPDLVVAYTAIQPTQVAARGLSRSQSGGHSTVPGYLIAKLALERTLHGSGLGAELLVRSLEICVAAAKVGGGRIIVVDPIDGAAHDFYRHHDFAPTKDDGRLVMKVATAEAALG